MRTKKRKKLTRPRQSMEVPITVNQRWSIDFVSAQLSNGRRFRVLNVVILLRILTDRGTEYCGKIENHDYQLYLAINDIDHTKTKAMSPQTNGICERFHKTILNEFYQVTFRKKLYQTLEELQKDLDEWLSYYNNERTHQGKMCNGRTPVETDLIQ